MNSIGSKFKHPKTIGLKNCSNQNIGHKMSMKNAKTPALENTPQGYIENYSNHPNNMYEPIKGMSYKPKQNKGFQIEKPKKQSKKSNYE